MITSGRHTGGGAQPLEYLFRVNLSLVLWAMNSIDRPP